MSGQLCLVPRASAYSRFDSQMSIAESSSEECLFLQASAQAPKTTEYKSYLEYELKKGDPARIQCLYERAMKENCLVGDMWTEYTSYLVSTLNTVKCRLYTHPVIGPQRSDKTVWLYPTLDVTVPPLCNVCANSPWCLVF